MNDRSEKKLVRGEVTESLFGGRGKYSVRTAKKT
jgi:hypothetical protein